MLIIFAGNTLAYCRNDSLQCCSNDYFEQKKVAIRQNLQNGLKKQLLTGNFEIFCKVTDDIGECKLI